jgi:hypothetical protein
VTTIDLTPLIVADLDDLIRGRSLAAPEDADLLALADGLSLATNHAEVAHILAAIPSEDREDHTSVVASFAMRVMLGEEDRDDSQTITGVRHGELAVARHLATVAASLCARGMTYRREAEALWHALSRLLGMEGMPDQATTFNHERMELTAAFATEWARKNPDVSVEAMSDGTLRMTLKTTPLPQVDDNESEWRNHAGDIERGLVDILGDLGIPVRQGTICRIPARVEEWRDPARKAIAALSREHNTFAELQAADEEVAQWKATLATVQAALDKARVEIDRLKRTHADDERALVEAHSRELRTETEKRVSIANAMSSVIRERDEAAKEVADLRSRLSLAEAAMRLLEPAKTIERPVSLRDALLVDTCHEATLYLGPTPGDLRVVVVLRDGKTLDDVQRVLAECGRPAGTCSLREVGTKSSFQRETDAISAQISGKG